VDGILSRILIRSSVSFSSSPAVGKKDRWWPCKEGGKERVRMAFGAAFLRWFERGKVEVRK